MGLQYFHDAKVIHLYSDDLSYVMKVNSHGILEHIYFGKRINEIEDPYAVKQEGQDNFQFFEGGKFVNEDKYYENLSKNELGTFLRMDLRPASLVIEQNEDSLTDFRFVSLSEDKHNEYPEEYPHAKNINDATRITIKMKDARRDVYAYLTYTLLEDVLLKNVRIVNKTEKPVYLKKAASSTIDLDFNHQKLIHFPGCWANERFYEEEELHHGEKVLYSLEGRSGHFENPFFIVADKETDENNGGCYSFNLIYSGNFKNEIFVSSYDRLRINVGINDTGFDYKLMPNEDFLTPEAVLAYSSKGVGELSRINHDFIREHILPPISKKEFPLLFNSWEGTGMDFNMESIKEYARYAKEIGAELFVLDDGWFSSRNDDSHGLGDWEINQSKVNLKELSKYVHSLGMKFGIWIEPEMINIDTKLYQEHPEWVISHPKLEKRFSRQQLVLDFSNPEVVEYIFKAISSSLDETDIDYVKYDMNRYLGDIYSSSSRQGEIYHRYVLGVYKFMGLLLGKYPNIIFENCASGGGRFDLGMLYFSPLIWCSDNTNPIDRTKIQHGTSYGYPLCSISSHVSKANGTYTDKANVAFLGSYGYEMNPLTLTNGEKEELLRYNSLFHKHHKKTIQDGELYRLGNPFKDGYLAELSLSKEKDEGFLLISLIDDLPNGVHLHLEGLDPNKKYLLDDKEISSKELSFKELNKKGQTKLLYISEVK